jgi:hypothetical protein
MLVAGGHDFFWAHNRQFGPSDVVFTNDLPKRSLGDVSKPVTTSAVCGLRSGSLSRGEVDDDLRRTTSPSLRHARYTVFVAINDIREEQIVALRILR